MIIDKYGNMYMTPMHMLVAGLIDEIIEKYCNVQSNSDSLYGDQQEPEEHADEPEPVDTH